MIHNVKRLKQFSWLTLVLILAFAVASSYAGRQNLLALQATRLNSFIGMVGTVFFSIALPILFRIIFYRRRERQKSLSFTQFRTFKLFSLGAVCIGTFFADFSILVPVFRYHLYLAVLAALYGVYTVFPFESSLNYDLKVYGVTDEAR